MLKLRIGQLHQDIIMQPGESIAQALLRKDYKVPMACGGIGTCGNCKVEIDGAWVNSCKLYPKPEEDIIISAFGWGEGREELTQIAGVEKINITVNKNMVPGDTEKAGITSGIRLGSAALTTRGLNADDFKEIGLIISKSLKNYNDENILNELKLRVKKITDKYPLWY